MCYGRFLLGVGLSACWLGIAMTVDHPAAKSEESGEKIVKSTCTSCHRIEGAPAPRRTKKAPDLIWAGSKYQKAWLESWLEKPEFKHYPVGYDFRPGSAQPGVYQALSTRNRQEVIPGDSY